MFDSIFRSLEETFVKFSFRRLIFWIFLICVGLAALIAFEQYTGFGKHMRLNGEITILERLYALEKDGIQSSPILNKEFEHLVASLNGDKAGTISFLDWDIDKGLTIKFLAATILWWALLIYGVVSYARGDNSASALIIGSMTFLVTLGGLAITVPNLINYWVNAFIFIILQILLIAIILRYGRKKAAI